MAGATAGRGGLERVGQIAPILIGEILESETDAGETSTFEYLHFAVAAESDGRRNEFPVGRRCAFVRNDNIHPVHASIDMVEEVRARRASDDGRLLACLKHAIMEMSGHGAASRNTVIPGIPDSPAS